MVRVFGVTSGDRPVVQLVERRSPKPKVGGSSPSWPATVREPENITVKFLHGR